MVLGAYYDGLYKATLVAHILCAIVGLGAVFLNALYGAQVRKRPGPEGMAVFDANFYVAEVAQWVILGIFVFGILLVLESDDVWKFSQTWVWLAMSLYIVAISLSHFVLRRSLLRMRVLMGELAAAGPPPGAGGGAPPAGPPPQVVEMQSLGQRVAATGATLNVIVVVILCLMVWKPGG